MSEGRTSEVGPHENHRRTSALKLIKLVHTVMWVFFAVCTVALPLAGLTRRFDWALVVTAAVLLECSTLLFNRGRCPLTNLASKFTEDRAANFDIYLPIWVAQNNKMIFGSLLFVGELFVLACWLRG